MNEDERLSLPAFQVMERCAVDLERMDLRVASCRLSFHVPKGYAERKQRSQREREDGEC